MSCYNDCGVLWLVTLTRKFIDWSFFFFFFLEGWVTTNGNLSYLELMSETPNLKGEVTQLIAHGLSWHRFPDSPVQSRNSALPPTLSPCLYIECITLALKKCIYVFQLDFKSLLKSQMSFFPSNFRELGIKWTFIFFHILSTTEYFQILIRWIEICIYHMAFSDLGLKIIRSFCWHLFNYCF